MFTLWSAHTIRWLLTNPAYLGEVTFRDTVIQGAHPAIIEPATFTAAERLLAVRGEARTHRAASSSDRTGSVHRQGHADPPGEIQPVLRDVTNGNIPGAGVPGHDRCHETDRASTGDENVLPEDREGQG